MVFYIAHDAKWKEIERLKQNLINYNNDQENAK